MNFKIIISPAKKMKNEDFVYLQNELIFKDESRKLLSYLKSLSYLELQKLYRTSDKIINENYLLLHSEKLSSSNALFSFNGIQYNYLSPKTLNYRSFTLFK